METSRLRMQAESFDSAFGIFWDECHSINSESSDSYGTREDSGKEYLKDDDIFDDENDDIQWLNDIGFACVIGKYKDSAEIDPNDSVLESMTATLTRNQSATVRKRIKSLNETWKKKKNDYHTRPKHVDVRDVFPVRSDGHNRTPNTVIDNQNGHNNTEFSRNEKHTTSSSKQLPGLKIDSCFYNEFQEQTLKGSAKDHNHDLTEHIQGLSPRFESERLSYRNAIDKNLNFLESSSRRRSKSPQPAQADKIRPPPPRRAKSEGICVLNVNEESPSSTSARHIKSPSEGSPVHCQDLASYTRATSNTTQNVSSSTRPSKYHLPSSSSTLSSATTSRPGQTVMKHKSEEDLSRLRCNKKLSSGQLHHVASSPRYQSHVTDEFDGDAKLNIGSDSSSKDCSSLFNGQAFPELPNFSLKQETLGMTRIADLSENDMAKVRPLALIELTALFDTYGVDIKRRKNFVKLKQKENGVFGVPLSLLWQKDSKQAKEDDLNVPKFFKELISYLERNSLKDEGLLRVPGSSQRIKVIREEIEECYTNGINFNWQGRRGSDMATILKQFLRELPMPLLTHEYQPTFIAVSDLQERKLQLQALNLLVLLMPPANRDTLLVLLKFLAKVVSYENLNKMDLNNVSMIMAPNLFLNPTSRADLNEIRKVAATTDIMRMLIKYHKIIWMVPGFMVTQIRYLYEAGSKAKDTKAVKKIIAKRMKSETNLTAPQTKQKNYGSEDELDFAEQSDNATIIRVKAPMFNKTCMAMQLTDYTTALDIIARFRSKRNSIKELTEISRLTIGTAARRNRSDSDLDREDNESITLHEVGGNIGERCLDPNTNMMALFKVNPHAEWVLRFKAPV